MIATVYAPSVPRSNPPEGSLLHCSFSFFELTAVDVLFETRNSLVHVACQYPSHGRAGSCSVVFISWPVPIIRIQNLGLNLEFFAPAIS